MQNEPILRRLMRDNVVAIVIAMVVIIPLMAPVSATWRVWRNGLFEGLGVLLLLALLGRADLRGGGTAGYPRAAWVGVVRRLLALLRSGITLPLCLYFGWAALSVFRTPYRAFSLNELLMLGTGVLICLVVAWHVEQRRQLEMLCGAMVLIVGLALFFGVFIQSSPGEMELRSSFGSSMMFGAFLALMTPFLAAMVMGAPPSESRWSGIHADDTSHLRQAALQGLAVLAGVALLLTQCRSAWAGGLVGLLLLTGMVRRSRVRSHPSTARSRPGLTAASLGLIVVLSGLLVFRFGPASDLLRHRVRTVGHAAHGRDESFAWRVTKWRKTLPLIAARPVAGWGLGSYAFHQAHDETSGIDPAMIGEIGSALAEAAHNEYLQIAVELGLVGLGLYLLLLASFFAKAGHALQRLPYGTRKLVLMGCMAGVAAQAVDAVANPAWRFPQCSLFFWLLLGMGTACVRMAYAGVEDTRLQTPGIESSGADPIANSYR